MPFLGSYSQGGKLPEAATITGLSVGDGSISVEFTEPSYRGKGSVIYIVTSNPTKKFK